MLFKKDVISAVYRERVVAIVRGIEPAKCLKTAEALYAGGIRMMEVTYDQRNPDSWKATAEAIAEIADVFKGRMYVGAGTVTKPELVELTAEAGGQYIISPNVCPDVIRRTNDLGLVSIPGAMTPSEILYAHDLGADIVKLFPASDLGTGYLKAIRAPISHVPLMATGGINAQNAKSFLDCGAVGLGVGGSLANRKAIDAGDFGALTEAAKELIRAINM